MITSDKSEDLSTGVTEHIFFTEGKTLLLTFCKQEKKGRRRINDIGKVGKLRFHWGD